jgi:hypothetical protein
MEFSEMFRKYFGGSLAFWQSRRSGACSGCSFTREQISQTISIHVSGFAVILDQSSLDIERCVETKPEPPAISLKTSEQPFVDASQAVDTTMLP